MSEQEADEQWRMEASNPATSAQRLEVLSADPRLRSAVAGNPSASAQILERLAADQDARVREQAAGNPNTPWQTLELLAVEFPHAFLSNPVKQQQIVAHSEQINIDGWFWDAVLRAAPIPPVWWNWLLSHPTLSKSSTVCWHAQYAGEAPSFYGAQEEGEWARLALAELLGAACDQEIPLPVLRPSSERSETTVERIISAYLQWLADHARYQIRLVVASNELTPGEALQTLAQDEKEWVRVEVASNEQTPAEVLHMLAQDELWTVSQAVAWNKRAPQEVLWTLAQNEWSYVRRALASNERAPGEILQALAQDRDSEVRMTVASNGQTPKETLRVLAQDREMRVRLAVARSEQVPGEVLWVLAQDEDAIVRLAVAENKQTPAEALRVLAQDQELGVKLVVAGNQQTPAEVLHMLAQDENVRVRLAVARNEQASGEILQILVQDQDLGVRQGIAGNEQVPKELLPMLAQDQDIWVRQGVASNWRTAKEVLQALAQDEEAEVRKTVVWNEQTPAETLHALTQDGEAEVRREAHLVERLLAKVERPSQERGWLKNLSTSLLQEIDSYYPDPQDPFDSDWIGDASIEAQVGAVLSLEVSEPVRQTLLATLAADWDTFKILSAFAACQGNISGYGDTSDRRESYRHVLAISMPPEALHKLATSPLWDIRYLVALHPRTLWETRQRLSQDGNRYVRAMAQACLAPHEERKKNDAHLG